MDAGVAKRVACMRLFPAIGRFFGVLAVLGGVLSGAAHALLPDMIQQAHRHERIVIDPRVMTGKPTIKLPTTCRN